MFRKTKNRYNLCGKVQIHHIIPLQHKNHPEIQDYDINGKYNLIFLPTQSNIFVTKKIVHEGGHSKYNNYVLERLDTLNSTESVYVLSQELRYRIRIGDETLPWK